MSLTSTINKHLYINSGIGIKSQVRTLRFAFTKCGFYMEKFSGTYGTTTFQGTPPKKIFVKLLGLKSLSEKGLKRKSKRITVKKYPYTPQP
jgi:hypothetical protein